MIKRKNLVHLIIPFYLIGYYGWLVHFSYNPFIKITGGNIFSILGLVIAITCLSITIIKIKDRDKIFWFLMLIASLSYLIAEIIWFVMESIYMRKIPFPGWPDFFYLLQITIILFGIIYKILIETSKKQRLSSLIDILILFVVASTFSWYFIISPIFSTNSLFNSTLLVTLSYPIGDLGILLATLFLLFKVFHQKNKVSIKIIIVAAILQIISDSLYLHLALNKKYMSGSLIDPLFITVMILIGVAGLVYSKNEVYSNTEKKNIKLNKNMIQLLVPYIGMITLLIFSNFFSSKDYIVTLGTFVSITLIGIRQIIMSIENQKLTERYQEQTEELELSKQRYRSLFDYHPDAVYSTDLKGNFDSYNASCKKLFNISQEDLIGKQSLDLIKPDLKKQVIEELGDVYLGKSKSYETVVQTSKNTHVFVNITNIPIIIHGNIVGIFGIGKDISDIKKQQKKIHKLAYFDALTGLSNRLSLDQYMMNFFEQTKSVKTLELSLFYIDLNRFKLVNDMYGHDIGDLLLVSVARRLEKFKMDFEFISRQGGDEFALLINSVSNNQLYRVANQLQQALSKTYLIQGYVIDCPPSIGISCYPDDASSLTQMIKNADFAMYHSKKSLSSNYVFFKDI